MKKHLFTEDHQGSRWTYGFYHRPPGISCQPDGYLIGSNQDHADYRYGTLDYPAPLTQEQLDSYELTFVGAKLTAEDVDAQVLYPNENCWKTGDTLFVQYPDRSELWQVHLQPVQGLYSLTPIELYRGMVHLEGMHI